MLLLLDSCSVSDVNELLVTVHVKLASPYIIITTECHTSAIYLGDSVHRPKIKLTAEGRDTGAKQCVLPFPIMHFLFQS